METPSIITITVTKDDLVWRASADIGGPPSVEGVGPTVVDAVWAWCERLIDREISMTLNSAAVRATARRSAARRSRRR